MNVITRHLCRFALPLIILAALCAQPVSPSLAQQPGAAAANLACVFPTSPVGTREETAWKIFTAAMCPTTNGALTFETWTEQFCWYNPTAPACAGGGAIKARVLHGSVLNRIKVQGNQGHLSAECNPMTTSSPGSAFNPFVPENLAANPTFCEEVFVNSAEAAVINNPPGAAAGVNLKTSAGQAAYIASKGPLQFPTAAIEIKVDWLPATSLNPPFNCTDKKPQDVYTEVIDGNCYALVGVHIASKLFPNWLWATFEPQNSTTNPNRCNPKLYSTCYDPWGSNPAPSTGASTSVTPQLRNLMSDAKLAQQFLNYRLVGVQTEMTDPSTPPVSALGNSFTELNAGVLPGQASCITCHSYAAINTVTSPPSHGFGGPPPSPMPSIGAPGTLSSWVALDFSWLLGFMPAGK